jgi:hypothetical protein
VDSAQTCSFNRSYFSENDFDTFLGSYHPALVYTTPKSSLELIAGIDYFYLVQELFKRIQHQSSIQLSMGSDITSNRIAQNRAKKLQHLR